MPERRIPQPQRVRKIDGSFAWIDHRLLRNGPLAVMTHQDQALYLFLCLAADRHGVSFYRQEKICDTLGLAWDEFHMARDRLIALALIAFEPYSATTPNGIYQVLPLEGRPPDFSDMALRTVHRLGTASDGTRQRTQTVVQPGMRGSGAEGVSQAVAEARL